MEQEKVYWIVDVEVSTDAGKHPGSAVLQAFDAEHARHTVQGIYGDAVKVLSVSRYRGVVIHDKSHG